MKQDYFAKLGRQASNGPAADFLSLFMLQRFGGSRSSVHYQIWMHGLTAFALGVPSGPCLNKCQSMVIPKGSDLSTLFYAFLPEIRSSRF